MVGQQNLKGLSGTPEWIRTTDLLLRRQTLYPAELRAHNCTTSIVVTFQPDGQTALHQSHPCPHASGWGWSAACYREE